MAAGPGVAMTNLAATAILYSPGGRQRRAEQSGLRAGTFVRSWHFAQAPPVPVPAE